MHTDREGMQILAKKPYLQSTSLPPCEHCLFGKQDRISYLRVINRVKKDRRPLDLVHSDVCGPLEVLSLGGNDYFKPFMDNASRKVWVYLLKSKEILDPLHAFQIFMPWLNPSIRLRIQR